MNDYFQNCYNLGVTCYNSGRYEEAVDALNKAIAVKSDSSETYFVLGLTYLQVGAIR